MYQGHDENQDGFFGVGYLFGVGRLRPRVGASQFAAAGLTCSIDINATGSMAVGHHEWSHNSHYYPHLRI